MVAMGKGWGKLTIQMQKTCKVESKVSRKLKQV